ERGDDLVGAEARGRGQRHWANLPHGGATREVVGVATTLATRTVSMYVHSCPLLSGQARSPRPFNSGEGFGISAVRNDLASVLLLPAKDARREGQADRDRQRQRPQVRQQHEPARADPCATKQRNRV